MCEIRGTQGIGWEGNSFDSDEIEWTRSWLSNRAASIYSGTNEIQRNIIAKRVLVFLIDDRLSTTGRQEVPAPSLIMAGQSMTTLGSKIPIILRSMTQRSRLFESGKSVLRRYDESACEYDSIFNDQIKTSKESFRSVEENGYFINGDSRRRRIQTWYRAPIYQPENWTILLDERELATIRLLQTRWAVR